MEQMFSEARNYERARRFMTKEVNAVIEAAFEHGADEVVVSFLIIIIFSKNIYKFLKCLE